MPSLVWIAPGFWLGLIGRHGALAMLLAVVIGLATPAAVLPVRPYLIVAMGFATLGAYLTVSFSAERAWLQPYVGLVSLWAALAPPVLVAAAALAFAVEPGLAAGLLLASLGPPASSAPAVAALLNLSPKLALAAFASGTLASPVIMPAGAALLGLMLDIDVISFGSRVLAAVAGGWVGAWLLARYRERLTWLVPEQAAATGISVVAVSLVFAVAAALAREQGDANGSAFLGLVGLAAAINVALLVLGAAVFSVLGLKDALTAGLLSGNRNVGLTWAAAGSQVPAAAEGFLAASLLIIALLPITLQQSLRLSARLRHRPLPDMPVPVPEIGPFVEPESVRLTVPSPGRAEVAWAPVSQPGNVKTKSLEFGLSYRIGRSVDCDIVLPGSTVSRQHATVSVDAEGVVTLRDSQSTNGIRLNGASIGEARISARDEVEIGAWRLTLVDDRSDAVLIEWTEPAPHNGTHSLPLIVGRELTIGRQAGVAIRLDGAHVSRVHAGVVLGLDGKVTISDLGSMNGMRFEGQVVRAAVLGDQAIHIGGYGFRVRRTGPRDKPSGRAVS